MDRLDLNSLQFLCLVCVFRACYVQFGWFEFFFGLSFFFGRNRHDRLDILEPIDVRSGGSSCLAEGRHE